MNDKGVVLLLVLIMLVVLIAVVVQFMFSTSVDSRIVDVHLAQLKIDAAVDGGVAKAISLLLEDTAAEKETGERTDSPADPWAAELGIITFEDTELRMLVVDEQGKLNLNFLAVPAAASRVRAELKRLLQFVGLDKSEAEKVVLAIADRIDEDNRLLDLSELLDIEHVDELLYYGGTPAPGVESDAEPDAGEAHARKGLHRFVTIWGPGLVNINTASAEVLAALSGTMDLETAGAVVKERDGGQVFSSVQDLLQVQGVTQEMVSEMTGKICVASSYFSALCFVETGGMRSVGIGVIERSLEGCKILRSLTDDSRLWRTYQEEIEKAEKEKEEEVS